MNKLCYRLVLAAIVALFLFQGPLLDLVGWRYSLDDGPFLTKLHPVTYIALVGAAAAIVTAPSRTLPLFRSPVFLLYLFAVAVLIARATVITLGGETGGEMSMALVGFLTPALLLIAMQPVTGAQFSSLAVPLRIFFVVDSLMALAERATGHRFIPSFLDQTLDMRAAGFFGHPLGGSLMTGLMIVNLVTARRQGAIGKVLPEIALHSAAMFAFGGRSALVFTPATLIVSALVGRQAAGQVRLGFAQRMLPIVIPLLALAFVTLPIQFVQDTVTRFTADNGSADTRNAAVRMFLSLSTHDMMVGLVPSERVLMARFYHTPAGFELSWISLAVSYGLPATIPLLIALPLLLVRQARALDRSALYMVIAFLAITAGSIGFGVKSLLVSQVLVMIHVLAQPRILGLRLPRRDRGGRTAFRLADAPTDQPPAPRPRPDQPPNASAR